MPKCKVCKKLLRENTQEFFNYDGPWGYKVLEKVGRLSYRCACNRCGHIWLSRSDDAKFQFERPQEYKEQRDQIERLAKRLAEDKKQGYTVLVFPKSIT